MSKNKVYLLLLFMVVGVCAFSQTIIYGTITDEGGAPIVGADIFIDDTDYYVFSEEDGSYEIEVEPGSYVVTVSTFGFDEKKGSVEIVQNEQVSWNVVLKAQSEATADLGSIIIEADPTNPENEAAQLAEQKKADVIIESIGGGEISRKGISDAGEAVKSIVGVSKEEGSSNVYVRGLGDRYQNTTMNGLPLPSNDEDKKNINLDIFNTDLIQSVGVSKTYNPNFSGDFAAGNVDITTKHHSGKAKMSLELGTGINTSAAGEDFVRSEGIGYWGYYGRYDRNPYAIVIQHGVDPVDAGSPVNLGGALSMGNTFKFDGDSKLSVYASGSWQNGFRYYEGVEGAYAFNKDTYFTDARRYKYGTSTTALVNLGFDFNKDHGLQFVSMFINNSSDEVGYFGRDGEGYDPDLADDGGYYIMNNQFEQTRMFVNQLIGSHDVNYQINVEWGIGYNLALSNQPDRRRVTLLNYGKEEPLIFSYDNTFESQRFFQDINDDELASRFEFKYKFGEKGDDDRDVFKVGYDGRIKNRNFESIRYGYFNFNVDNIDPLNLDQIFNLDNFLLNFDNSATPVFQTNVVRPAIPTNIETGFPFNNNVNLPGKPEAIYSGKLVTYAPYVAYEFRPSEKLTIVPGLRFEKFDQRVVWDVVNVNPGEVNLDEAEFLPSLNVKYSPAEDMNFRLAGSRTVSIPEFKEVAPFVYSDVVQDIGGNPDLINPDDIVQGSTGKSISDIYNFDLKWELFPSRGELLSVAAFSKIINAPVNLVVANDAANVRRFFRTGDKATVLGAELEFEKEIAKFSHGELSVGGNFAYIYTKQDLYSEIASNSGFSTQFDRDEDELQGASPIIFNADISYDAEYGNYETTLTLAGNYFSDRIYALGSTGRGNQIEKGVPTLNFIWQNKIGKHLEANLSAKNILNPEVQITQENTEDGEALLRSYKKGVGIGLSLRYNF